MPVQYRDFSGGYVDDIDPAQIKPNESPDMVNVVIDDPVGSLKPRNGYTLCGTIPSGNVPTAIYEYSKSDGTRRLIATDNQNIYSTPDCQTWTTVWSGLSASDQVYFATVRDKLWIVDGSTWPIVWDGTTAVPLDTRTNTPNPGPGKCSFIEFWKERVWCGAPNGDPSGVSYSALTDTNGNDVDPSTGTLSWPASNVFEIDQNGGSRLYGIRAYRNRMYAFKDNGVWEIGFDDDFNNFVRKTYATVGSRFQTSITESDGILYFVGRDGIYAFDGDNAVRVSKKIENKFKALNQPLISQNYKLWTTPDDFLIGSINQISTTAISGSLVISTFSSIPANVNADFEKGNDTNWTLSGAVANNCSDDPASGAISYTGSVSVTADSSIQGSYALHIGIPESNLAPTGCYTAANGCGSSITYKVFDGNGTTLIGPSSVASGDNIVDLSALTTNYIGISFSAGTTGTGACASFSGQTETAVMGPILFNRSNHIAFTAAVSGLSSNGFPYGRQYVLDNIRYQDAYYSTGTWTSEIYNTVAVSTWGALRTNETANGGSIQYQIHYGTNTGAVQEMAYQTILPGSLIPAATNQTYVQVKAVINAKSDQTASPQLDDVQIAWNSGGNNTQKIYSASFGNRLWVAASSGSATTNNIVLQRAKAPLDAWMPQSLNIGPMTRFNDNFYAASSTWSAIYRMDYGTNDDGAAIPWHWESRDENWGIPNNAKQLQEIDTDYRNNSACNIRIGYVQDQDTTYCVGNFPSPNALLASGVGSRKLNFNGGPAYTYRFKICDDQKDQVPTIVGIQAFAKPINRRGD